MNALRRHQRTYLMLLLATLLLATQALLLWHTHFDKVVHDQQCELCLHAQHHTPAPATIQSLLPARFTPIAVAQSLNTDTFYNVYRVYIPSRAPPAGFFG